MQANANAGQQPAGQARTAQAVDWLVETQDATKWQDWPAGVLRRSDLPRATVGYEFSDVSIERINGWLEWAGVELPVELDGQVSGWFWMRRSSEGWTNWREYRIEIGLESPQLDISGWPIQTAKLRLGYAAGDWYVGSLSGNVLSPEKKRVASVDVRGRITTSQDMPQVHLTGKVERASLDHLFEPFGLDALHTLGAAELDLLAQNTLREAADPDTWLLAATAKTSGIEVFGGSVSGPMRVPLLDTITAELKVNRGRWNMDALVRGQSIAAEPVSASRLSGESAVRLSAVGFGTTGKTWDLQGLDYSLSVETKRLELGQISEVTERLPVAGEASASALAEGSVREGLSRVAIEIPSTDLEMYGQTVQGLSARFAYLASEGQAGVPRFEIDIDAIAGGSLSATFGWASMAELTEFPKSGVISVQHVDLSGVRPDTAIVSGRLSLDLELESSATVDGLRPWSLVGNGNIDALAVAGVRLGDFAATVGKRMGESEVLGKVASADGALKGALHFELANSAAHAVTRLRLDFESDQFQADVELNDQWTPCNLTGAGNIVGTPERVLQQGNLRLEKLALALPDTPLVVDSVAAHFTDDRIELSEATLSFDGGTLNATGEISRRTGGQHALSCSVKQLNLGTLATALGVSLPDASAVLSGQLVAMLPAAWRGNTPQLDKAVMEASEATLDLEVHSMALSGLEIGSGEMAGEVRRGNVDLRFSAGVLGGTAKVKLAGPLSSLQGKASGMEAPGLLDVAAEINGVELSGLVSLSQVGQVSYARRRIRRSGLGGRLDAKVNLAGPELKDLSGGVELRLDRLRSNAHLIPPAVELRGKVERSKLVISDASTKICGGILRASGSLDFSNGFPSGRLRSDLRGVSLASVSVLAGQTDLGIDGRLAIRSDLRIDRQLSLKGTATVTGATVDKLQCDRLVSDFSASVGAEGFRELRMDLSGNCLGGRLSGRINVKGASMDTRVQAKLDHGRADQLSDALGFPHIAGRSRCNAWLDLRSTMLADPSKLSGAFSVELSEGDARSIPVVSELTRFVPLSQLASAQIESGVIDGRFRGRQVQILDCFVSSSAFWLMGKGKVSTAGRLDLEILLQTGGGLEDQIGQVAVDQLLRGVLPQAFLLGQINELLQDRSVFLHVGGTTAHPVLQVRPVQSAARNLLSAVQRQLTLGAESSLRSKR